MPESLDCYLNDLWAALGSLKMQRMDSGVRAGTFFHYSGNSQVRGCNPDWISSRQ
jgi:hypothetical protein